MSEVTNTTIPNGESAALEPLQPNQGTIVLDVQNGQLGHQTEVEQDG